MRLMMKRQAAPRMIRMNTEGGRLVDGPADVEVEDAHRHHLVAGDDQKQRGRGLLEGQDEGVEGAHQDPLPDQGQRDVLEGPQLGGADALGRLLEGAVDDQQRGEGPPHRVGEPPDRQDDGDDDPHADEGRGHEGEGVPEGAHVGDADAGPRQGQDQRGQRVEDLPARQLGPGHHPGDGHPHGDADHDRDPRIEQAVDDELGRLEGHPLEVLEGVLHREGGQRPALAEGIEREPQVGDEGQDQDERQEGDRPHLRQGGELLPLDHRIGEGAVVLDRHVLLGDDQKQDGQDHHDGRDHDPHLEEPPVHELDDVQVGLGGQQVGDAHHQRGGEIGEGPDEDQQRPGDVARGWSAGR